MFDVAAILLVLAMVLANMRALRGPTVYDRILAVNMFGSVTILLLAVLGYRIGRPDMLDIAFIYALISFAGVLAVLRFVEKGSLGVERGTLENDHREFQQEQENGHANGEESK